MRTIAALAVVAVVALATHRADAWPGYKHVDTTTYPANADVAIAVDDASGDVSVTGWESDKVEVVTTRSSWSEDDVARLGAKIDAAADRIGIVAEYPNHCLNCDVSFRIHVPRGSHITVRTASGDIGVKSVAGPVRADAASGDISISDTTGETHAHASSGDIDLERISATLQAYSSSGDISAKELSGDAELVATSGSVSAEFSPFEHVRTVRLESSSGDVSLTVPRGSRFKLSASTESGSIDDNLRLPVRDRDSGADVLAQIGSGGANVQLVATSGDISITMR